MTGQTLHATTIAIAVDGAWHAVLLTGRSGSGKSDLALRLIDRGARLVADDYTDLAGEGGRLLARAPARIAGRIEVRGIGIVAVPPAGDVPVALVVALDAAVERMPEPAVRLLAGIAIPAFALAPFEASAPVKVEWLLRRVLAGESETTA